MKTAGGIIIPDTAKEKPMQGEVIAIGPGTGARRKDCSQKLKSFDGRSSIQFPVAGILVVGESAGQHIAVLAGRVAGDV